jgi:hypothetical protein
VFQIRIQETRINAVQIHVAWIMFYLVSYKSHFSFFRDVSKLLEQGQGEPKTAGLGAGAGGVHAGQQLEETAEKTPPETATGEKACCRCQAAAEKEAETIDCLIFIFYISGHKCIF